MFKMQTYARKQTLLHTILLFSKNDWVLTNNKIYTNCKNILKILKIMKYYSIKG